MMIFALQCDRCDFRVGPTGGGYTYVVDANGNRVDCLHLLEERTIERVTGMSWEAASAKGLVHYMIEVLCSRCAQVFDAESKLGQSTRSPCPRCGSIDTRRVLDGAHTRCPRCARGTLRRQDVGVS